MAVLSNSCRFLIVHFWNERVPSPKAETKQEEGVDPEFSPEGREGCIPGGEKMHKRMDARPEPALRRETLDQLLPA
jgi:hypothetical protein